MTVVMNAVHQQSFSARTGAAGDHHGMRVEPLFDFAVDGEPQLRAGWCEKYRTWMQAPIGHCIAITATLLPHARPTAEVKSAALLAE